MKRFACSSLVLGVALAVLACNRLHQANAMVGDPNPTQRDGRGEPSLDDPFRPAAWVSIDGKAGRFRDADGGPLVQWIIDEPVSSAPTFRVTTYESLLGSKVKFRCALQPVDNAEGKAKTFALKAKEGKFEVGKEYKLLTPGDDFEIREAGTDKMLPSIDPLSPGQYVLAATITRADDKGSAVAVTYFTVK